MKYYKHNSRFTFVLISFYKYVGSSFKNIKFDLVVLKTIIIRTNWVINQIFEDYNHFLGLKFKAIFVP